MNQLPAHDSYIREPRDLSAKEVVRVMESPLGDADDPMQLPALTILVTGRRVSIPPQKLEAFARGLRARYDALMEEQYQE